MNPAQRLALKKAALWLATLFVLLYCSWLVMGGILTLASIPSPVFPSLSWMDREAIVGSVIFASIIAGCQVFAVWRRVADASFLVGVVFVGPGLLGVGCGFLVAILSLPSGKYQYMVPEPARVLTWDVLYTIAVYFFFVASWLFVGVVMMDHAIDLHAASIDE